MEDEFSSNATKVIVINGMATVKKGNIAMIATISMMK